MSYDGTNFAGVHRSINLNSNNNAARRCVSLQQSAKLHNRFKEINMKKVVLLDSNSNIAMMCHKNYAERVWDTRSSMSIETNGRVTTT